MNEREVEIIVALDKESFGYRKELLRGNLKGTIVGLLRVVSVEIRLGKLDFQKKHRVTELAHLNGSVVNIC